MSAFAARFKNLANNICNSKFDSFKQTLDNVYSDPKKLLEMPALVKLAYRDNIDVAGLERDFNIQITDCLKKHVSKGEFLSQVFHDNPMGVELFDMIQMGINDAVGNDSIQFCLNEDNLRAINAKFDFDLSDEYIGSVNSCFNV